VKRAADQEKLRELDRLRLEVETLSEFKSKVLESQASLQRDLKKVKKIQNGKTFIPYYLNFYVLM